MSLIKRDIYEITTEETIIHGVMFRGTIRKLCLQNNINVLLENTSDKENTIRFALISDMESTENDLDLISKYIYSKISDANVTKILSNTSNPILSKLQCNLEERYAL